MKKKLRKIFFAVAGLAAALALIVLLVAAMKNRNEQVCAGFEIKFKGNDEEWFMDKNDIIQLLEQSGTGKIKGQPIVAFDLYAIEKKIQQNAWVKDVDLHFDNNQVLQIYIEEEQPGVRIFDNAGNSFYFSKELKKMPLSKRVAAKVPVVTGFPSNYNSKDKKQKLLAAQVVELGNYIQQDEFWKAQIEQINIHSGNKVIMVPLVGNHFIQFGTITDIPEKFKKLEIFYRQVLLNVGMNKYKEVNVQYDKQIVAVKR